jgi:hypothetical protein
MSEVNVELYRILKGTECHLEIIDGKIVPIVCIYSFEIRDFCEAVGDNYFDEGGVDCKLTVGGDIWLEIDYIIEGEDHLLSSYGDCFEEWPKYRDRILKEENEWNRLFNKSSKHIEKR